MAGADRDLAVVSIGTLNNWTGATRHWLQMGTKVLGTFPSAHEAKAFAAAQVKPGVTRNFAVVCSGPGRYEVHAGGSANDNDPGVVDDRVDPKLRRQHFVADPKSYPANNVSDFLMMRQDTPGGAMTVLEFPPTP